MPEIQAPGTDPSRPIVEPARFRFAITWSSLYVSAPGFQKSVVRPSARVRAPSRNRPASRTSRGPWWSRKCTGRFPDAAGFRKSRRHPRRGLVQSRAGSSCHASPRSSRSPPRCHPLLPKSRNTFHSIKLAQLGSPQRCWLRSRCIRFRRPWRQSAGNPSRDRLPQRCCIFPQLRLLLSLRLFLNRFPSAQFRNENRNPGSLQEQSQPPSRPRRKPNLRLYL